MTLNLLLATAGGTFAFVAGEGERVIPRLVLLLLAPLLYLPWGVDTREVPRAALVFFFCATVMAQPPRWAWPWFFVCVAGAFWAPAPVFETWLGALPLAQGTLLWLAYGLVVTGGPRDEAEARRWHALAAALAIAQVGIAATQTEAHGTLGHPVFFGAFCAIGVIVSVGLWVDRRQTLLSAGALVMSLLGLAMSARRGPWLMALAGVVGMLWLLNKRRLLPAVAILAALTAVPLFLRAQAAKESASNRVVTFSKTAEAIAERPLSGFGPSRFADRAATWTPQGDRHYELRAHNVLLLIAFSLGVPALLAFLWFAANAIRRHAGSGMMAASAVVGPAYGVYLLVDVDQPGVGLWVCALFSIAVAARGQKAPLPLKVAFMALGLLPVVGSVAIDRGAFALADATKTTGCLAVRAEAATRRDPPEVRIEKLSRCHEGDWLTRYHLALAYEDAGRSAEALGELERILKALPGLDEVELAMARVLVSRGDVPRAIDVLQPWQARPENREAMERYRDQLIQSTSNAPTDVH